MPAEEKWLLIDCLNTCHRLFHALPPMNGPDTQRTEVIFGFLREIKKWEEWFKPCRLFFFFDFGWPKRKAIYPAYKENREESRKKRAGTDKDDGHLQSQVRLLRQTILHRLGYNNVYAEDGYEADDLIAIFTRNNVPQFPSRTAVIVSSDQDFLQCLYGHVLTDGGRTVLKQSYVEQYDPRNQTYTDATMLGMTRREIILAKAVEGCSSDNIPGVPGYGPRKAGKFAIAAAHYKKGYGELEEHKELIERNIKLVTLPIDWDVIMEVEDDTVSEAKWLRVMRTYGIRRIRL